MDASAYNKFIYTTEQKFVKIYYEVFDNRIMKVMSMLKGFEGSLLDVGCGDATITKKFKDTFGCKVIGVDLIEENIVKAKEKGIDVKLVDLNCDKLPFKAGSFDGVFSGEVLEHVVDTERLLDEMKRVLKKDGILLITVPNIANWYNRFLLFLGYLPHFVESGSKEAYGTPYGELNGHVKAFTQNSLVKMLERHGFRIEKVSGAGLSKTWDQKYNTGLLKLGRPLFFLTERGLSRKSSLATNIVVKAIKN